MSGGLIGTALKYPSSSCYFKGSKLQTKKFQSTKAKGCDSFGKKIEPNADTNHDDGVTSNNHGQITKECTNHEVVEVQGHTQRDNYFCLFSLRKNKEKS